MRGQPVKKHAPYVRPKPVKKCTPAEQAAFDRFWAELMENRQRLRKTRDTGDGQQMTLAERLLQRRRETGQQVRQVSSREHDDADCVPRNRTAGTSSEFTRAR